MDKPVDISSLMSFLVAYAAVGQAAMAGMFLSGFFIILTLAGLITFNPLYGFITVPIACLWMGIRGLRKHEA